MTAVVAPKRWIHIKITGTQHHHKLILHSSFHVSRVLVVTPKLEQGTIRVGNEQLIVITGALIARVVTQRSINSQHQ